MIRMNRPGATGARPSRRLRLTVISSPRADQVRGWSTLVDQDSWRFTQELRRQVEFGVCGMSAVWINTARISGTFVNKISKKLFLTSFLVK